MLKIKYNYDISNVSYIKVGGKVKLYIETDELECIKKILKVNKRIKYIGNTSNIFFSFYYCDYIFIKYINKTIIIDKYLEIGSSVSIKYLSSYLANKGISGFEKLEGIPCTLGGGIRNNISCFNQCISTNLVELVVLNEFLKIITLKKEEIVFLYHQTILKYKNILIIKAKFTIVFQDKNILLENKKKVELLRRQTQPHNKLTLGSTFKHYTIVKIPFLIEQLNLKGKKMGNSMISNIHSNFIEVTPKEKFENIISLIEETNRLLYNKLGYYIDLEIEKIRGN